MQLQSYTFHYSLDFPCLVRNAVKACILTEQHGSQMLHKELLTVPAPNVFQQIEFILKDKDNMPFNYVDGINDLSRNVLQVFKLLFKEMIIFNLVIFPRLFH